MKEMTKNNIWSFFDIIHPDRGQPGSKCKGRDEDLLFRREDLPSLNRELKQIRKDRDKLMIHASDSFFDLMLKNPNYVIDYSWNCAYSDVFPSWVTVDCDGKVYPCDDFQVKETGIPMNELYDRWSEAREVWKKSVLKDCPGCIWNTHVDANHIKEGKANISDYVHKQ